MAVPVIILGKSGQVAKELALRAPKYDFSTVMLGSADIDITSRSSIRTAVNRHRPALLINAAAYTAVDKAESDIEAALNINAKAPQIMAEVARDTGIPLFHISTDYVFDGSKTGAYSENDPPNPCNAYGRSKAEGEALIADALDHHIILRTSWLFSSHGSNFVKTMMRLAVQQDEIKVVDDQYGCPTYAGNLAAALLKIAAQYLRSGSDAASFPWGLYHFTNGPVTSWYGFAASIMTELASRGWRVPAVLPIKSDAYPTAAKRPKNSELDCSLIEEKFGIVKNPWADGLRQVLDELVTHHTGLPSGS